MGTVRVGVCDVWADDERKQKQLNGGRKGGLKYASTVVRQVDVN